MNSRRIVLNMIVKNEAHIITECLRNVLPLIDAYAIVDTGSTDTTIEVIQNVLATIPGRVSSIQWTGFADARNAAISLASGLGDYVFFLDADDKVVYEIEPSLIKEQLTHDLHHCIIKHGKTEYERVVFRSLKSTSRFQCSVHEVLVPSPGDSVGGQIDGMNIIHNALGVSDRNVDVANKYLRDALMLEAEIERNNNPELLPRLQFYLAQSYRDHGDFKRAIAAYERRYLLTHGWDQERYMSAIEAGNIYGRGLGSVADQLWAYTRAIEIDPRRAEAYVNIATLARVQKLWGLAYSNAIIARDKTVPTKALFIDTDCYSWRSTYEVSIAAFYVGKFDVGLQACNELLANPDVPVRIKQISTQNRGFYLKPSPNAESLA